MELYHVMFSRYNCSTFYPVLLFDSARVKVVIILQDSNLSTYEWLVDDDMDMYYNFSGGKFSSVSGTHCF